MEYLILIIALIFSIVFHELAHGIVADKLGDDTPRNSGRLTLNPVSHIDPVGSIMLPLILFLLNAGFIFGWAKPVPINYLNFKNPKKDIMLVALAGPLSNILFALLLTFLLKFWILLDFYVNKDLVLLMIRLNIVLAVFNLLPIPPLDGSKIFFNFLPFPYQLILENWGFLILIFILIFAPQLIFGIINYIFLIYLNIFGL
jgi:Zn-dependent protease